MSKCKYTEEENHPYKSFYDSETTCLIVGSTPPRRFALEEWDKEQDMDFYYGSRSNTLWSIIFEINGLKFNPINAVVVKKFLKEHHIGVTDIVDRCQRKIRKKGVSAADKDLRITSYRNLENIFSLPNLKTIYFTSRFVEGEFHKHYKMSKDRFNFVTLISPSNAINRYLGTLSEYKKRKAKNPKYNTRMFRIENYSKYFKFS